jgi:hypothetical protein
LKTTENLDITVDNDILSIKKLNKKSNQLYECSALNKEKNIITRLMYSIDILNKRLSHRKIRKYVKSRVRSYFIEPIIDNNISNLPAIRLDFLNQIENITRNSKIKIRCSTINANWTIEWYYGDSFLNSKFNKNILIVDGTDLKNGSLYKCVAKNSHNINQIGIRFKQNNKQFSFFEGFFELIDKKSVKKIEAEVPIEVPIYKKENDIKLVAPNYNYEDEDENIDDYDNDQQNKITLFSGSQKSIRESDDQIVYFKNQPSIDLVFLSPKTSYINIGDRVEIQCKTKSSIKYNQNWIKNTSLFSTRAKFQQNNELLIIESFEDEDIGIYSCLVNDFDTRQNLNIISFQIQPVQFDLFTINIIDSYVTPILQLNFIESLFWLNKHMRNLDVTCISPTSKLSPLWKRDVRINFLNFTKMSGNVLKIDQVNQQHIDNYVCSVSNEYGSSTLTYRLDFDKYNNEFQFYLTQFQSKTKHHDMNDINVSLSNRFALNSDFLLAELNSPLVLQCPIRNSKIKWHHTGHLFKYMIPNTNTGDLFISKMSLNNYGKYICEYNDYKHLIDVEKVDKIPYLNEKDSFITLNITDIVQGLNSFKVELTFQLFKISLSANVEYILLYMSDSNGKYYMKLSIFDSILVFK